MKYCPLRPSIVCKILTTSAPFAAVIIIIAGVAVVIITVIVVAVIVAAGIAINYRRENAENNRISVTISNINPNPSHHTSHSTAAPLTN
jgi:hypothetical protein